MKVDRWRTLVNCWVLCHSQTCTSWHSVWMWCVVQSAANVELVEVVSRGQIVSLSLWDERRHSELTEADWDHKEEDQWTPHYNSLTERTQNRWLALYVHFWINNGVYFVSASVHRSTSKWAMWYDTLVTSSYQDIIRVLTDSTGTMTSEATMRWSLRIKWRRRDVLHHNTFGDRNVYRRQTDGVADHVVVWA